MDTEPKLSLQQRPIKLDLGGGAHPREGFDSVDIVALPTTAHVLNLFKFPWPFEDAYVDELNANHFVEHIPLLWVGWNGSLSAIPETSEHKEMFFAFFDECYRILKPGGLMTVQIPALQTSRAFQDPTHRRFIPAESFQYLNKKVREQWGIAHYNVDCDFDVVVDAMIPNAEGRAPEAEKRMIEHYWNYVFDWKAVLKKR